MPQQRLRAVRSTVYRIQREIQLGLNELRSALYFNRPVEPHALPLLEMLTAVNLQQGDARDIEVQEWARLELIEIELREAEMKLASVVKVRERRMERYHVQTA